MGPTHLQLIRTDKGHVARFTPERIRTQLLMLHHVQAQVVLVLERL